MRVDPRDPLGQHPTLGGRIEVLGHMCPDCGWPVKPFCPTCKGTGMVSELELMIWQRRQDDEHPEVTQGRPNPVTEGLSSAPAAGDVT